MRRVLICGIGFGLLLCLMRVGAETPLPSPAMVSGRITIEEPQARASVGGKYRRLLHTLEVPRDESIYGAFNDWGYWPGTAYAGHQNLRPGYWVYVAPRWYVWGEEAPAGPARRSWGPEQATGEPDTFEAGDLTTAWASKTQDGQEEWLELRYPEAVSPSALLVHETYNPGALVRVTAFSPDGREVTVWTGKDPLEPGSGKGVAIIPFRAEFKTERVRITLDSPAVSGWNEIDAVGLVDEFGRTQWASDVKASSTYAE